MTPVPFQEIEGIRVYTGPGDRSLRELLFEGRGWFQRTFGSARAGSLEEGMRLWKRPPEAEYFLRRESNPSHRRAVELARRHLRGRVLDVGCGVGHLLRKLGAGAVGLDASFANLYLARRFVAPGAELICADAAAGLPLDDGAVDGVACVEAFTYVRDRGRLAREMRRVWNGRSGLVLSHLHRTPAPHAPPVTAAELESWFPGGRVEEESAETCALVLEGRG